MRLHKVLLVKKKDMKKTFNLIFLFYQYWSLNGYAVVNFLKKLNDKELFIKTNFSFIDQSLKIFFLRKTFLNFPCSTFCYLFSKQNDRSNKIGKALK